jgi:hypothetical protein
LCVEAAAPPELETPAELAPPAGPGAPAEPALPADSPALVRFEPELCAGFVVLAPWVLVPWVSDWCEGELGVVVDVLAACVVVL